jgi:small-conductance mechanosensitive channel
VNLDLGLDRLLEMTERYFGQRVAKGLLAFFLLCVVVLAGYFTTTLAIFPAANKLENVVTGNQGIVLNWLFFGIAVLIGIAIVFAGIMLTVSIYKLLEHLNIAPKARDRTDTMNTIELTRRQLEGILPAMDEILNSMTEIERRLTNIEQNFE